MPTYITPLGHEALIREYEFLLKQERPRITAEVQYAASLGDRSENAEYQYGKQRLREIDRRLRYLQKRLEGVEVIDPADFTGPVVRFGATVVGEDEEERELHYQIVGKDEIDTKRGLISYVSPLGRALVGCSEGDDVVFEAPGGTRELVIIEVLYPARGEGRSGRAVAADTDSADAT